MPRPFLSPGQVTRLRKLVEGGAMPDVCAVVRPGARVPDGRGGWTTGADVAVEVGPCAITPAGTQGTEAASLARLGWSSGYVLSLPYDSLLTPADDVVVNGVWHEVGAPIDNAVGEWAVSKRFLVRLGGAS